MTLASKTPLIGGGGIDTFMNRAFALPSTGVAYTALRGGAGDRVVLSAPYLIGGIVTIKTEPINFALMIADPRSAIDPRVIERPFEKGLAVGGAANFKTEIAGLRGFHTLRAAYSNARGIDLEDIPDLSRPSALGSLVTTKKGFWFTSYAIQQNFVQSEENPKVGGVSSRLRPCRTAIPALSNGASSQVLRGTICWRAARTTAGRWFLSLWADGAVACGSGRAAREPTQRGRGGGFLQSGDYALAAPVRAICKRSLPGIPASRTRLTWACVYKRASSQFEPRGFGLPFAWGFEQLLAGSLTWCRSRRTSW